MLLLLSPSYTPEYNGSAEAGIGWLKINAEHEAIRNDRPGEWTCNDIEVARLRTNETARPHGLKGPTPDQAWAQREPITQAQRDALKLAFRQAKAVIRRRHGFGPDSSEQPTRADREDMDRISISKALMEDNILSIRRRRVSLPLSAFNQAKIS